VRFKITLNPLKETVFLSYSYQEALVDIVKTCLYFGDSEDRIQEKDKIYGFSWFKGQNVTPNSRGLHINGPVDFYVHSPSKNFCDIFSTGVLRRRKINPLCKIENVDFLINEPIFIPELLQHSERMRFTCLSPIYLEKEREPFLYLEENHQEFSDLIFETLQKTHYTLYNKELDDHSFHFKFENTYNMQHKLIKLRGKNYICYLQPFFLEGLSETLDFAYASGLGYYTQLGFGSIQK